MTHRTQLRSGLLAVLVVVSFVALGGVGAAQDGHLQSADSGATDGAVDPAVLEAHSASGSALATDASATGADGDAGATPTYRLDFEADGTYSFGVPGPTDQTVGDLFVDDLAFDGVVYAYDADAGRWTQVTGSQEVDALDAFVVRAQEPTAAVVRFDADDSSEAVTTELEAGLNHVAATEQSAVQTAFEVDNGSVSAVVDPAQLEQPSVSPGAADDFERVNGTDDVVVDPFAGYFVEVDADETLASDVEAGMEHEAANDALNVSAALPDPYFAVDVVDAETASLPGPTHHVTANVTNEGPFELTQPVSFVHDGSVAEEHAITLAPGESVEKTFQIDTAGAAVGAADVTVETALDRAVETSEVRPERTVETQEPEPGDAVTVSVGGTVDDQRTVVLTERFASSVADSTLESVTVGGQTVTPDVNDGGADSHTVVLSDVDAGELSITYELDLAEDHVPGEPLAFADGSTLVLEDDPDADGEAVEIGGDQAVTLAEPPAFDVEIVDADVETVAGGVQTVEVEAENVEGENGTGVVAFDYGSGLAEQREILALAAGDTGTATFEVDTTGKPIGSYDVAVDGGNGTDTATAQVLAERSVDADTTGPGATLNVTLDAVVHASETVVINERFDGAVADAEVTDVRVDGNQSLGDVTVSEADGDAVTVVLDDVDYAPLEIDYQLTVAADAAPDDAVTFTDDSFVVLEDAHSNATAEVAVGGDDAVSVATDEPYFAVSNVGPTGQTVEIGESQTVTADLTNVGGAAGTQNVTFRAVDANGTAVGSETFTRVGLDAGNETTLAAAFDAESRSAGEYDLVFETEDDEASTSITVVEEIVEHGEIAGVVEADVVAPDENVTVDVAVLGSGHGTTVTLTADDPAASYAVEDVPAGDNYTVAAENDDFSGHVVDDVVVEANETTDLDLELQRPTGAAEVAVQENESGDAIENASVEVHQFGDQNATLATASTDANGTLELQGLPIGEHAVAVDAEGYDGAATTVEIEADETASETVELDALAADVFEIVDVSANATAVVGQTHTVDVEVTNVGDLAGTYDLTLDVANGTVVQNESLTLDGGESTTETFGVDTTGLAPGDYEYELSTAHHAVRETITIVDDGPDAGDVAGDVTLDVASPEDVAVTVEVVETGDETTVNLQNDSAVGTYAIDGLDADENYTVVASAPDYEDATVDDVVIEANETTDVDLALHRLTGTAELTVVEDGSGDAIENASVEVGAFGDRDSIAASTSTDANGTAAVQNLPVGEHALVVSADGFEDASATVDVAADQTVGDTVELTALAPAEFGVEFVDADATSAAGANQSFTVEVENDGDSEATQDVTLEYDGTETASESITLDGGETATETFVVETDDDQALGGYDVTVETEDDTDAVESTVGAERSIETATAAPGETVEITVGGELGAAANFTLIETFDPGFADGDLLDLTVDGTLVFPQVQNVDGNGTVIVPDGDAGPGTLEITYEVEVPGANETSDGTDLGVDDDSSVFELDGQDLPIVGDDVVTVDG